ncbi:MAG: MFS transporter, partial [Solirubrobacteraceae bacterium]
MKPRLSRDRNFARLWSGEAVSQLGSQITAITMPLLVLALTGSAAEAGLIGVARTIVYPLAALPAGIVADRFERRRVMMSCAAGRAIAIGSVPLALALGHPSFAQLLL